MDNFGLDAVVEDCRFRPVGKVENLLLGDSLMAAEVVSCLLSSNVDVVAALLLGSDFALSSVDSKIPGVEAVSGSSAFDCSTAAVVFASGFSGALVSSWGIAFSCVCARGLSLSWFLSALSLAAAALMAIINN